MAAALVPPAAAFPGIAPPAAPAYPPTANDVAAARQYRELLITLRVLIINNICFCFLFRPLNVRRSSRTTGATLPSRPGRVDVLFLGQERRSHFVIFLSYQ